MTEQSDCWLWRPALGGRRRDEAGSVAPGDGRAALARSARSALPGQFTIGVGSAGRAHVATFEDLRGAVRQKLRQHHAWPIGLSWCSTSARRSLRVTTIVAMLYGRTTTTRDPATPLTMIRRHKAIWPGAVPQHPDQPPCWYFGHLARGRWE